MKRRLLFPISVLLLTASLLLISHTLAAGFPGITVNPSEPPAKQAIEAAEQRAWQAALVGPQVAPNPAVAPVLDSCPTSVPSGISPYDPTLHGHNAGRNLIDEASMTLSDGLHVTVFAGAADNNPAQGIITVVRDGAEDPCALATGRVKMTSQSYPAPAGWGPITIESVSGDTLQVVAAGGQGGSFDVDSGTFR